MTDFKEEKYFGMSISKGVMATMLFYFLLLLILIFVWVSVDVLYNNFTAHFPTVTAFWFELIVFIGGFISTLLGITAFEWFKGKKNENKDSNSKP